MTRRNTLGLVGASILPSGLFDWDADEDSVSVSIDDECSSASIEMHPPDGDVWTGVVEFVDDDSEVTRRPAGGQTVSGGSSGTLQISISSPGVSVHRAYVVEGSDVEGPLVAEETCESSDEGAESEEVDACASSGGSGTSAWAVNVGDSSNSNATAIAVSKESDGDTIVQRDDS